MLESRLVLSAVTAVADAGLATVTEVSLGEVELNEENQLVANVTVAGTNADGDAFSEEIQVPLELSAVAGVDGPDSLTLSFGGQFDIDGLQVNLDNGDGGPVKIAITGTADNDDGTTDFGELIGGLSESAGEDGLIDPSTLDPADLDTLVAGTSDVLAGVFESLATAIGDEDGSTGDEGSLFDIELEPVELASELSTRTGLDVVVEDPVHLVVTDLTSDDGDGDGDDGSGLGRENLLRNVTRVLERWEAEGKTPGKAIEAKERILERIMADGDDVEELLFSNDNGRGNGRGR